MHASHSMPISMNYFTARILIFLFLSLHCKKLQNETYIKMRSITKGKLKKISYSQKKEESISSNIGQNRAKLISRIEFVSSISYIFLHNTHF